MYDENEKAIRDHQWKMRAARQEGIDEGMRQGILEGERQGEIKGKLEGERQGEIKGKIELIRALQPLLYLPVSSEQELRAWDLPRLEVMASELQEKLRNRTVS